MRWLTSSHPRRSLCGQSVSTLCRLAAMASTVMAWMRFTHSSLLAQVPTVATLARVKCPAAASTRGRGGAGGGFRQLSAATSPLASAGRCTVKVALGRPLQPKSAVKSLAQPCAGSGRQGGAPVLQVLSPHTHTW
jgi:hypothetical protein